MCRISPLNMTKITSGLVSGFQEWTADRKRHHPVFLGLRVQRPDRCAGRIPIESGGMRYGEIRNCLVEFRTCEAHYAAAQSRKTRQPRVVRPAGIRTRRKPWLLDKHFRFRSSCWRLRRLEQTVGQRKADNLPARALASRDH